MAFKADYQGGKTTEQLPDQYGRRVILMNGFDFKRHVFWLPGALADPSLKVWKLVYQTLNRSFTCARPARGAGRCATRCADDTRRGSAITKFAFGLPILCAQFFGEMFTRSGDWTRARKWLNNYATDPSGREITPPARAAERGRQIGGLHLANPRP
jgi:hypothetical protein